MKGLLFAFLRSTLVLIEGSNQILGPVHIFGRSVISTVSPTVHTSLSRKRSFSNTLNRRNLKKADFAFSVD